MAFADNSAVNVRVAQINITPLVDVMLVLLIIFMVTMPLRTHGIVVDMPQRPVDMRPLPPVKPIALKIDANGGLTWNGTALPLSALESTMKVESARYVKSEDQPVVQIATDRDANYGTLASVLAAAKNAGLVKIGFVEDSHD